MREIPGSELIEFDFSGRVVKEGGSIPIPDNTNGILVINIGPVLIFVNGCPLNPPPAPGANGESWTIGGWRGEICQRKTLDIAFSAPGGIAFVQFKWYPKTYL